MKEREREAQWKVMNAAELKYTRDEYTKGNRYTGIFYHRVTITLYIKSASIGTDRILVLVRSRLEWSRHFPSFVKIINSMFICRREYAHSSSVLECAGAVNVVNYNRSNLYTVVFSPIVCILLRSILKEQLTKRASDIDWFNWLVFTWVPL